MAGTGRRLCGLESQIRLKLSGVRLGGTRQTVPSTRVDRVLSVVVARLR